MGLQTRIRSDTFFRLSQAIARLVRMKARELLTILYTQALEAGLFGLKRLITQTRGSSMTLLEIPTTPLTTFCRANASSSESTVGAGDGTNQNGLQIFSNGFAIPHTLSGTNRNGSTFIFCAWGENPLQANNGMGR